MPVVPRRPGEHANQGLDDVTPDATAGVAIPRQPAQIRRQHRIRGPYPVKQPPHLGAGPCRRVERLRVGLLDPIIRTNVDYDTRTVSQPSEEVRRMPTRPIPVSPRQPKRLRRERRHIDPKVQQHHMDVRATTRTPRGRPSLRTTTSRRNCPALSPIGTGEPASRARTAHASTSPNFHGETHRPRPRTRRRTPTGQPPLPRPPTHQRASLRQHPASPITFDGTTPPVEQIRWHTSTFDGTGQQKLPRDKVHWHEGHTSMAKDRRCMFRSWSRRCDFVRENGSQMFVTFGATWPAGAARLFVRTSATC